MTNIKNLVITIVHNTGGVDYGQPGVPDPQTFTANIPSGSGQGNLLVAIINDTVVENEEQFTLNIIQLSQQCNVALTGQTSTNVTIVDDDGKMVHT